MRETTDTFKMAGVPTEVRTQPLTKTSILRYSYMDLLDGVLDKLIVDQTVTKILAF
jgi:hypothetical protein